MSDEVMIRDEVLMDLANRTRTDPEFKRKARTNLEGTLNEYGYELTEEELAAVKEFHQQTRSMTDKELDQRLVALTTTARSG